MSGVVEGVVGVVVESGVVGAGVVVSGVVESGVVGAGVIVSGVVEGVVVSGVVEGVMGVVVESGVVGAGVVESGVPEGEGSGDGVAESGAAGVVGADCVIGELTGWVEGWMGAIVDPSGAEGVILTSFSVGTAPFVSFAIDSVSAVTGNREPARIATTLAAAIGFNMLTFISKLYKVNI